MAVYGGWNGLAEGLKSGMALGQNAAEIRLKRQALINDQIDAKIEMTNKAVDDGLALMIDAYSKSPRRDQNIEKAGAAYSAQLEDTAKALAALGTPKAQAASQNLLARIQYTKANLKTGNEIAFAKSSGEIQGKVDMAKSLGVDLGGAINSDQTAPGTQQQVASATMPGQMPQAAPALPTQAQANAPGALPDQTLPWLSQPDSGLGSTAQAEPALPTQQAPTPAPDQGQTQPMPSQVAQATPPAAAAAANGPDLRARMLEQIFPPTEREKQMAAEQAKSVFKERADVDKMAIKSFPETMRGLKLLDSGIISGAFADERLYGAKIAKYFGYHGEDAAIKATEEYQSILKSAATLILSRFGSGTGISNIDYENAQSIVGGNINLEPEALRSILQAAARQQVMMVEEFNQSAPEQAKLRPIAPHISSDDDYNKLRPGAIFVDPNGEIRQKPQGNQ